MELPHIINTGEKNNGNGGYDYPIVVKTIFNGFKKGSEVNKGTNTIPFGIKHGNND